MENKIEQITDEVWVKDAQRWEKLASKKSKNTFDLCQTTVALYHAIENYGRAGAIEKVRELQAKSSDCYQRLFDKTNNSNFKKLANWFSALSKWDMGTARKYAPIQGGSCEYTFA